MELVTQLSMPPSKIKPFYVMVKMLPFAWAILSGAPGLCGFAIRSIVSIKRGSIRKNKYKKPEGKGKVPLVNIYFLSPKPQDSFIVFPICSLCFPSASRFLAIALIKSLAFEKPSIKVKRQKSFEMRTKTCQNAC